MSKRIPFLLFLVSFLVMLPSWNKYWAPYDEGYCLIAARMITEGMVPYKSFFLVMNPPAQFYVIAGLFLLFGVKLLVSRLYSIVLLSIISTCVFYITRKITSFKYALSAFILTLVVLASWGEPPIPRPIWPGVALSLLAVAFIMNFIEKEKTHLLMASSFFVALVTMFRHDIGFLTFMAILAGLFIYAIYLSLEAKDRMVSIVIKRTCKLWALYSILPFLFVGALTFWLYRVNAAEDAVKALFTVPATFGKWAGLPFPQFCFDLSMIFHRGCLFIRRNKFFIPILVCAMSGIFFFAEVLTKRKIDKRTVSLTVLILLGVFYLQQLIFRTDTNHLAVSFAPSAILFAALFTYKHDKKWRFFKALKVVLIAYMSLLMILVLYRGTEKYIKDVYIKPFIKNSIEPATFKQGTIYLPDDAIDTFVKLVEYIEKNTAPDEKIYVGFLKHNVPQMGWFDLIYFLADRLPAVKYYLPIYGFQSRPDIQIEMAKSLKRQNAKVLLLRDFGESDTLGPLDKYIRKEYKLDKVIDTYNIYVKK